MFRQLISGFERRVSEIIRSRHEDQQELLLQTMATIGMTLIGGTFSFIFSIAFFFAEQSTYFWFFLMQIPYSLGYLLAFHKGWISLRGLLSIFIFSTAIFTTFSVMGDGGFDSAFVPWLSLTPLVGFVLIGRRGLLIWGAVSIVLMGIFVLEPEIGGSSPKTDSETLAILSYSILYLAEMATVAMVVWMRRRWAQNLANLEANMLGNQKREEARRKGERRERARILELLNHELEPLLVAAEEEQKQLFSQLKPAYPDSLREGLVRIRAESQRIVRNLSQPLQGTETLQEAIKLLSDDLRRGLGVEVNLEVPDSPALPMTTRNIHIFRIVQEACRNVARHSSASQVGITLWVQTQEVFMLQVADDGIGWPPLGISPSKKRGQGLQNIADRTKFLGGEMEMVSPPEGGATLRCHFPIHYHFPGEL